MRLRFALVALSLAANAAFGFALWQRHTDSAVPFPSATSRAPTSPDSTRPAEIPVSAIWSHLTENAAHNTPESDAAFVARLRAEGFPKTIIRLLVRQRILERFASEYQALAAQENDAPYWIRHNYSRTSPENRAARRVLDSQVNDIVRSLLGADADKQPGEPGYDDPQRLYGDIPAAKISQLEAINKDYGELIAAVRESSLGITLPEDREKLRFLEDEQRADLAALLTPDELEQYDRRHSPAAREVRQRIRYFDATESEFIALYRIQTAFDQQHGALSETSSSRERTQRHAASKELDPQIEAALGPDRYAEYQLTTHRGYEITHHFVADAGLPPATTRALVTVQRDTELQRDAIRSDRSLDHKQRDAALADLQKGAAEKALPLVGAHRMEDFKQQAGYWLRHIAPAPAPAR